METIPALAPPLALSPRQIHFLTLHVRHNVDRWRWHWFETLLRAHAGNRSATLWRDEVTELVRDGLMEYGAGSQIKVTVAGVGVVMAAAAAGKVRE